QVTGAVNYERGDLKPAAHVGLCYNLRVNVDFDVRVNLYQDAKGNVSRELKLLASDLKAVRTDINDLKSDADVLTNHGAAPLAGESSTVATEEKHIGVIVGEANKDINQVNREMTAAYSMANQVASAHCPGQGPPKPTQIPQVN